MYVFWLMSLSHLCSGLILTVGPIILALGFSLFDLGFFWDIIELFSTFAFGFGQCSFFPVCSTSWSSICSAGLLEAKSSVFYCFRRFYFIFKCTWKLCWVCYSELAIFSFRIWNMSFHFLLACKVFSEKSAESLIGVPL